MKSSLSNSPYPALKILRLLLPILLFLGMTDAVTCFEANAKRVATTMKTPSKKRKKTKGKGQKEKLIAADGKDSLQWKGKVVFLGFDKQSGSSVESFHVSNRSDHDIRQLTFTITYLDSKGRMLHRRKEQLDLQLPAGETRKVDIKSFDTQGSFHYVLSTPGKKPTIPFDVTFTLHTLTLSPQPDKNPLENNFPSEE